MNSVAEPPGREPGRTVPRPGSPGTGPAPGRARKLDKPLADPLTWNAVDAAVQWAGDGPGWPYAVVLGPDTVTVRLAGRTPAQPPEPWRPATGGWTVDRAALIAAELPDQRGRAYSSAAYVALGSQGSDIVFIDLGLAPGLLGVDGDPRARTDLVSSLMAQVTAGGLHVTCADLTDLLGDEPPARATDALTFLICSDPDSETAVRLHKATLLWPWLRVVVLGDTRGSRWSLSVDVDSVVTSPALGLSAASSGLPKTIPPRPAASPAVTALREPEPVLASPLDEPFALDEHPGLLPLPPRGMGLDLEAFLAAPIHEPTGARSR